MSRERSLIKNTFFISLGTFLPKLTTFITLPILTACLTKAEYGTIDLLSTLTALILPIGTLKIEAAAFRFLIDCRKSEEKTKEIVSTIQIFLIPVAFLVALTVFCIMYKLPMLTRVLICLYYAIDIFYSGTTQILRGLSRYLLYSAGAITNACINMTLIVLLIYKAGEGLNGYIIAMTTAAVSGMLLMSFGAKLFRFFSFRAFSVSVLKQMLQYSWPMVPNSLSLWVMNLSDRFLILAFMGIEANAVYAVANKIPKLFGTLQGTFVAAWQENASLAVDDEDAVEYYSKIFDTVYSMLAGIMAGLIAITPLLFKLLIRGDYHDAYYQMPFLFAGMLLSALSSFLGGIYVAHKKTKSVGVTTTIAAASNFLINILFIRSIGLYAASVSTFVSFAFLVIYRMYDVQKIQRIIFKKKKIFATFVILVVMCAFVYVDSFVLNCFNFAAGIIVAAVLNWKLAAAIWRENGNKIRN